MAPDRSLRLAMLRVVMIEPSETQAKITEAFFHELGVRQMTLFRTGQEALEYLSEASRDPVDVVFSAMHLPDTTATELVAKMRSIANLVDMPFVLTSSETRFSLLEPIRQSGAVAMLPKPYALENLKQALNVVLDLVDPSALDLSSLGISEMRILVVDDSRSARWHIRKVLESLGFELFVEAENGRAAIHQLSDTHFDLVVTDYHMPELDGKELIRAIRTESWQRSLPVIMVTSDSDEMRLAAVRQEGADAVVEKPFAPDSVRNIVYQILSDRPAVA